MQITDKELERLEARAKVLGAEVRESAAALEAAQNRVIETTVTLQCEFQNLIVYLQRKAQNNGKG